MGGKGEGEGTQANELVSRKSLRGEEGQSGLLADLAGT